MTLKSALHPKYVGWTLFFLSVAAFLVYHVCTFSTFENALFQGTLIK